MASDCAFTSSGMVGYWAKVGLARPKAAAVRVAIKKKLRIIVSVLFRWIERSHAARVQPADGLLHGRLLADIAGRDRIGIVNRQEIDRVLAGDRNKGMGKILCVIRPLDIDRIDGRNTCNRIYLFHIAYGIG